MEAPNPHFDLPSKTLISDIQQDIKSNLRASNQVTRNGELDPKSQKVAVGGYKKR